jgi:hypothetical protein
VSGSGPGLGGDGRVSLSRGLWAAVLVVLEHGDVELRVEVYAEVVRLGFPGWLSGAGTGDADGSDDADGPPPQGWVPRRPRLSAVPASGLGPDGA